MQTCSELDWYIPAGGQGIRLRPLTENVPKPLLPVFYDQETNGTESIIDYSLYSAIHHGGKIAVSTCYRGDDVVDYINRRHNNYPIVTVNDGSNFLGPTAGLETSIQNGILIANKIVFIAGDTYLHEDVVKKLIEQSMRDDDCDVMMLVSSDTESHDIVYTDSGGHVDNKGQTPMGILGVYVVSRSWLLKRFGEIGQDKQYDMRTSLVLPEGEPATRIGTLAIPPGEQYFEDLGSVASYGNHVLRRKGKRMACFPGATVTAGVMNVVALPGSYVFHEIPDINIIANFNATVDRDSIPVKTDKDWGIID